jgi:hypothetical protein
MVEREALVARLLDRHGRTFAEEAGIDLRGGGIDAAFQLCVAALLIGARIRSATAVAAARSLFEAGLTSARRMHESTWQQRVDALGRGGYVRYDESTATKLEEASLWLRDTYSGDLRRIRPSSHDDTDHLRAAIAETPRIGQVGAAIFCREVQAVWPTVAPFFDDTAVDGARSLGLPTEPDRLAALAPDGNVALLAAALVRHALSA